MASVSIVDAITEPGVDACNKPLSVSCPTKVRVLLPLNVIDAAVNDAVALDVSFALVFSDMALVPPTTPGPKKFKVDEVPSVTVVVIPNVMPEANVNVTGELFARVSVAIEL